MIQIHKAFISCSFLLALTVAASAQPVSIATTPAGSFTNSAGAAIAKVVSEKTDLRAVIQAQAMQGQIPVEAGSTEFGISNSFDAAFYVTGTGEYEGQGEHKNVRLIGSLTPFRVAMHVRADSDIKSLADLKGRRLSSEFNAQKTIKRIIEAHLASVGLTYKDVIGVPTPNVLRSSQDFTAGRTDAFLFAVGSAAVKQAAAKVGGLRVLPVDQSPEALKRVEEILPTAYLITVKPAPNIEGITKPTKLVAFDMVLLANKNVSDETAYKVAKALHENKDMLKATFKPFVLFNPANMAKTVKNVPFHPGALKYYREAGLLPKS